MFTCAEKSSEEVRSKDKKGRKIRESNQVTRLPRKITLIQGQSQFISSRSPYSLAGL